MRYLSLFSGIEAATQAWQPLGWECVAVSEIEPFPCAVLEHHYPNVPNLGDVTKITEQQIKDLGQIDLIVFGSPCQNLSVAGNRKGLQGSESSLFYAAMEIIKYAKRHCKTRFALWENVPGAFSSNRGADFTEVVKNMAGLSELDTPTNGWGKEGAAVGANGLLEWSVLDAQWFGLAQRRKRVFAIVDFGDWASRPPILLERESLRGDSAPSRETRESVTADVRGRLASGTELAGPILANCGEKHWLGNQEAFRGEYHVVEPVAYPIDTMSCHGRPGDNGRMGLGLGSDTDPCYTLSAGHHHAVAIAGNIIGRTEGNGGNGNGFDESGACYTLTTNDRHAVAYSNVYLESNQNDATIFGDEKPCTTLVASMGMGGGYVPMVARCEPIAAYGCNLRPQEVGLTPELSQTLRASDYKQQPAIFKNSVVRRLTPIECEKLQGFPVDFTKIPYRNKSTDDCPNGPRYKALGNSMAVNVMAWIGKQIHEAIGWEENMLEKDVKDKVKDIVAAAGKIVPIYTMCPMTFGYGESGHPDRLLYINGRLLGIECKKDGNTSLLRPELKATSSERAQKHRLREITEAGGISIVVHSGNLEQFKTLLEKIINHKISVKV